jgi:hypothetical protein
MTVKRKKGKLINQYISHILIELGTCACAACKCKEETLVRYFE